MNIREAIKLIEAAMGDNGGPPPIRLVADGTSMGRKIYKVMQGDKRLCYAYAKYTPAKKGIGGKAGGTTYSATIKGDDFYGSKSSLIAWIEKKTAYDI